MTTYLRIDRCSDPLLWYASLVGARVPLVRAEGELYWSREPGGFLNIVHRRDATVVASDTNTEGEMGERKQGARMPDGTRREDWAQRPATPAPQYCSDGGGIHGHRDDDGVCTDCGRHLSDPAAHEERQAQSSGREKWDKLNDRWHSGAKITDDEVGELLDIALDALLENERLRVALADAIRSPMGVVPDSATPFTTGAP